MLYDLCWIRLKIKENPSLDLPPPQGGDTINLIDLELISFL
jgi:hypothetical protein